MSITTTQIICQEGDTEFGMFIEPGALTWDLENHKMYVFWNSGYDVSDTMGIVAMIWREDLNIVAGITWLDDRYDEDLCPNTTIMANQIKKSGDYKTNDIKVTSGIIREVFLAGNLPWGNGVMDVAYPSFPKEVVEKIDSKES